MNPVIPQKHSAYTVSNYGESIPDEFRGKYNPDTQTFENVTITDEKLERFARIIAYKTAHNLKLGYEMDPLADPLTYVDCGSEF